MQHPATRGSFDDLGWEVFEPEPRVADWAAHVLPLARDLSRDPENRRRWLRHGGTWFVGVNLLENDGEGRLGGGPALEGRALQFARDRAGPLPLDPAQISITYPGYPRRDPEETLAAHKYRRDRCAAHLDGLLPVGAARRRMIREPAAFVLGYPLNEASAEASPLVVWERSHHVLRDALRAALGNTPSDHWSAVDITEAYQAARRRVFETCRRVSLSVPPGGAILLHRLTLHGVAPWGETATAPPEGRMIAYFRPDLPGGAAAWLSLP